MEMLRKTMGLAMPLKLQMEKKAVNKVRKQFVNLTKIISRPWSMYNRKRFR